jgi:hypothetical protein
LVVLGQPTKVIDLGQTEVPEDMFMELLEGISDRFKPHTFNIM